MSRVAIIVPCHNYASYVAETLHSLAAQTRRPDELVVVDDGSIDDSAAVAASVLAGLGDRLPGARVVSQPNRGLVGAVARGLAETDAEIFAVVSADDRARPRYVEALAAALDADPRVGYAYPLMEMFGDEQGVVRSYPFSVDRLLFDHNYITGSAMMRRSAYEQVGGLRGLPAHEDWDLFLALAERGWPGVLVPEVLCDWRRHAAARNHRTCRSPTAPARRAGRRAPPAAGPSAAHGGAVAGTADAVGRRVRARIHRHGSRSHPQRGRPGWRWGRLHARNPGPAPASAPRARDQRAGPAAPVGPAAGADRGRRRRRGLVRGGALLHRDITVELGRLRAGSRDDGAHLGGGWGLTGGPRRGRGAR